MPVLATSWPEASIVITVIAGITAVVVVAVIQVFSIVRKGMDKPSNRTRDGRSDREPDPSPDDHDPDRDP